MKKVAVVCAGQGAQFVGMGKDLAEAYPVCRALFERADEVLGYSLSEICFEGPIEELTKSDRCQPGIFVASVACWTALSGGVGELPLAGVAGLSLGEWTALHLAGALSFEDTVRVLEARGRFMQEACEEQSGAMVSVMGLPMESIVNICAAAGVEIANLNSAEQTVLSGERPRIEEADRMAKAAGAKRTVMLNVAGAFHSSLMASAAARLDTMLKGVTVREPSLPVPANVTGQPHGGPEDIKAAMVRQVTNSVRWASCVEWFKGQGVGIYAECGPGRVLSGLIKRLDGDAVLVNVQDRLTLEKAVQGLQAAV